MKSLNKKPKVKDQNLVVLKGSGKQAERRLAPRNPGGIVQGGVANGDMSFWTPELLNKLNRFNYQKGNNKDAQTVYEQARGETQKAYLKRKETLEQLKKALKGGNKMLIDQLKADAESYLMKYQQQYQMSQMQIFQLKNKPEFIDMYLDLHGLQKVEALNIVRLRLRQIQQSLDEGRIVPLTGDGRNHVVKIVCGRGIHSKGRAVLKYAVPQFLVSKLSSEFHLARQLLRLFQLRE